MKYHDLLGLDRLVATVVLLIYMETFSWRFATAAVRAGWPALCRI
jgi:hypothetical protein